MVFFDVIKFFFFLSSSVVLVVQVFVFFVFGIMFIGYVLSFLKQLFDIVSLFFIFLQGVEREKVQELDWLRRMVVLLLVMVFFVIMVMILLIVFVLVFDFVGVYVNCYLFGVLFLIMVWVYCYQ